MNERISLSKSPFVSPGNILRKETYHTMSQSICMCHMSL